MVVLKFKLYSTSSTICILIANQNKAIFATEIICITKVKTMKEIREKINSIDDKMLKLLAERRQLSVEIIKFKNEEKSSIRDKEREKQVLTRLLEVGREYGLDGELDAWLEEKGLELRVEYRDEDEIEQHGDGYDISSWQPSGIKGDGWFVGSIHDTDDGAVCIWLRSKEHS